VITSPTKTRVPPTRIAPDTFVLHNHQGEGQGPVCVPLNTMVVRGAQPVVIDTGMAEHRDQFFEDLFGLVEPEDVRWVFISHDDVDHTGNLNALLEVCPNATLVINWFVTERMGESLQVPPTRWRWIEDGDTLDVGDRQLLAVRPPVYDSPTTRGLFDATTGVYWGSDAFAAPMPSPVVDVAELDPEFWLGGMGTFHNYISPWLSIVDDARYQATVDRIERLSPAVIAGCHTPVIRGERVAAAIAATRLAPTARVFPLPHKSVFDKIQKNLAFA